MINQIRHSLKQITGPVAKLGDFVLNSVLGEVLVATAKIVLVGIILGLIATVAVLTFTAIIMVLS